jgi:hypothetical protein
MLTRSQGPVKKSPKAACKKKGVKSPNGPEGPADPDALEYIYAPETQLPEIYTVVVWVIITLMVLTILMAVSVLVAMTAQCVKYATVLSILGGLAWFMYERNKEQLYPMCTYMWDITTDSERVVKHFIVMMCVLNTAYSAICGSSVGTFVSVVHLFVSFAYPHIAINTRSTRTILALGLFTCITTCSDVCAFTNNRMFITRLVKTSRVDAEIRDLNSICDFNWKTNTLEMWNIDVSLEGVSAILECASLHRPKKSVWKISNTTKTVSHAEVLVVTKILSIKRSFLPVFNALYELYRYLCNYEMGAFAGWCAFSYAVFSFFFPFISAHIIGRSHIAANVVFSLFKYIIDRIWADYQNGRFSPKFVQRIYYVLLSTGLVLVVSTYTHSAQVETYIEYLDFAEIACMLTGAYLLKNDRIADYFRHPNHLIDKEHLVNNLEFRMTCVLIISFIFPLSSAWMYLLIKYNNIFDEDKPVVLEVVEVLAIAEPLVNPVNWLGILGGAPDAVAANNPNAGM